MQFILYGGGLLLIAILWSLIEQRFLDVTRYTVISDRLPENFDGTSIVLLADLHNKSYGRKNERLIRKIDELSPDFIVVAGDMIVKKKACIPSTALSLLNELATRYRIYYSYGNHEQEKALDDTSFTEYRERLTEKGVIFLDNTGIEVSGTASMPYAVNGKLRITGLTIGSQYYQRSKAPAMDKGYLDSLILRDKEDSYQILIAHNPIHFKEYVGWGADLVLSGHLHGGLIRLPFVGGIVSPQVRLFPKYDAGLYQEGNSYMVVSRGLGFHSIMIRLFNRPELIIITLKQRHNGR